MIIDKERVRIKVTGDYACFTRPDLKVERMTYPCMTPSAARGVLEAILWKPQFIWYIHRIIVLNPIQFTAVKRNEINSKQTGKPIVIEDNRTQLNSIILKDVAYIIEASVCLPEYDPNNSVKKYREMFNRRVQKGQCWHQPYLGTREFSADFSIPTEQDIPFNVTYPIGSMLFDLFFDNKGVVTPLFFYDVAINNGILECPSDMSDKMIESTHIQPIQGQEFNRVIYEFNTKEETL